MHKNGFLGFVAVVVLSLSFTACKDAKTLQENTQLKAQVAELQKENGQLGNDIETVTAARDALTKQTLALQEELKRQRSGTKASARKRHRSRKSQQS